MSELEARWKRLIGKSIEEKTFHVWMNGHYLDIEVILNVPQGLTLHEHLMNLLRETYKHALSRGAIYLRHEEVLK